jgi:predicted AAA+ superfamily ATPase
MRQENISGILENIVFMDLIRRGYQVYVGKQDSKEIDFVAEKSKRLLYIQVCLNFSHPETKEREFAPLRAIKDHWPKMVVTLDKYWQTAEDGVVGIHLRDFLLRKDGL